jgi:hypothetical protein
MTKVVLLVGKLQMSDLASGVRLQDLAKLVTDMLGGGYDNEQQSCPRYNAWPFHTYLPGIFLSALSRFRKLVHLVFANSAPCTPSPLAP